jgi:hypothetical protein
MTEEAGYKPGQLKILQPKGMITSLSGATLHPYPACLNTHNFDATHMHTDLTYVFTTDQPPVVAADEGESIDFKLVSEAELRALSEEDIPTNVQQIMGVS